MNGLQERLKEPKTYAVWHPDEKIRMSSSSGGAFTLLAEAVIRSGGVVFGAAWNESMQVVVRAVETMDALASLRESKYVAATPENEFRLAKAFLAQGREVLYSGTPCQIAGLYAYLGDKTYANLTTVDFVCHGAPDRRVWEKYVRWLECRRHDQIRFAHFRDKRWGVECNLLLVLEWRKSGTEIVSGKKSSYYWGFIHNYFLRKGCLKCNFNGVPRRADFSLADFRGLGEHVAFDLEREKPKGFTGVLVNSEHALRFLSRLSMATWAERPLKELADSQPHLRHRPTACKDYDAFWSDFDLLGWGELARRYLRPSMRYRLYIWARRILRPALFMRVGIVYKKIAGLRTTSWRPGGTPS